MYIKLRSVKGEQVVITVSKTDAVTSLKAKVEKEFGISKSVQRLFFAGKQLEDDYTLFDYKINVNDTIIVMKKPNIDTEMEAAVAGPSRVEQENTPSEVPCDSPYFRIGDIVDACDTTYGAWFEGKITSIAKSPPSDSEIYYTVTFTHIPSAPAIVDIKHIRPISRNTLKISTIKENDLVMVNYNVESPEERGYWYDLKVKRVVLCNKSRSTYVEGTLYAGVNQTPIEDVRVVFPDEILEIVDNKLLAEKTREELDMLREEPDFKRKTAPLCHRCKDNPRRKCTECGCEKCGGKEEPDQQIVCDECENNFHIWCLNPPLEKLPDTDDWYCNSCKNDDKEIVYAGERLKETSKKAKKPSSTSKRDWGRGMACVGFTKECTLVSKNHFGPIPGVEVGTTWKYRFQVSESGVHRPHVAGIHGRDNTGAFSLVLSGGYEDDIDSGEEFLYTGSGGRDLSGNKRTAEQSCDQQLTRMNRALAINCNTKLNDNGGESLNWLKGKPVRVVRNYKLAKHSKFAPIEGNRYDGIYKVVKYYTVKGRSGFKVWRYLLRRDDPAPAPWTKEGKERIASLGLTIQYPESYLDSTKTDSDLKGKRAREENNQNDSTASKKTKISYSLSEEVKKAVAADKINAKLWTSLLKLTSLGQRPFLDKVEEQFSCVCCMGLVYHPITTSCSHNICKNCLKRSFDAGVETCPSCRAELDRKSNLEINTNLSDALNLLFPGYIASN